MAFDLGTVGTARSLDSTPSRRGVVGCHARAPTPLALRTLVAVGQRQEDLHVRTARSSAFRSCLWAYPERYSPTTASLDLKADDVERMMLKSISMQCAPLKTGPGAILFFLFFFPVQRDRAWC